MQPHARGTGRDKPRSVAIYEAHGVSRGEEVAQRSAAERRHFESRHPFAICRIRDAAAPPLEIRSTLNPTAHAGGLRRYRRSAAGVAITGSAGSSPSVARPESVSKNLIWITVAQGLSRLAGVGLRPEVHPEGFKGSVPKGGRDLEFLANQKPQ